ncbi:MAG: hypothetical protein OK441_03880 [Thaumarchaeota archaeon]|nr:hypothetical protein [Nitrososphaerota archaeon]
MKSKPKTLIASMVVLSFLLMGIAPVVAQVNPNTSSTSSSSTSTASGSNSGTNSANTLTQLAEAAQGYVGQLLSIAQSQGVTVTAAQSLITQGDGLLTQAQSVVSTNATLAAKDALGAMADFKSAAQSLQSEVVVSVKIENQVQYLQNDVMRIDNRTGQLQTTVNTLCSAKNASATVCGDAKTNLSQATSDTTQASTLLGSITASSTGAQITAIASLLSDATSHLQQVASDINQLANSLRNDKAVQFIQTVLDPRAAQLQQQALNANITSSQRTQIQGQLGQAQTLLGSAVTSFQSGNFSTGLQQTNQATQLLTQAAQELAHDSGH